MKLKVAVKRRCEYCYFARRRGHLYVCCPMHGRHKQRQGTKVGSRQKMRRKHEGKFSTVAYIDCNNDFFGDGFMDHFEDSFLSNETVDSQQEMFELVNDLSNGSIEYDAECVHCKERFWRVFGVSKFQHSWLSQFRTFNGKAK